MTNLPQAALFIDADNFSDTHAIDAAWAQVKHHIGRVSVCRAYGNAMRLQTLGAQLCTLGARAFPNLSLEKNTTDAALVADAVALHFQHGIRFFAIASGDADFAPLAVRLREWGCTVWCFSMEGILFQGAENYYDRVVRFSLPKPVAPPSPAPTLAVPKLESPSPKPALKPIFADFPELREEVLQQVKSLPQKPTVKRILVTCPELCEQEPQYLSQIAKKLRDAGLLGKNASSLTLFRTHASQFELLPKSQPNQIRYRGI